MGCLELGGHHSEEQSRNCAAGNLLNQLVHRRIVVSICRQPIRCAARDHKVCPRIELESPESSRWKRFLFEVRSKVVVEPAGEDEYSRCAPTKRNESDTPSRVIVNARDDCPWFQHQCFRLPL